jgi:hypothetical protein
LPLWPVLASTVTQNVVDGHDTETRPLPGSMLLAADQVPPGAGLEALALALGLAFVCFDLWCVVASWCVIGLY